MKEPLTTILERVQHWSENRQEDVAEILRLIEEHDHSPYKLSAEQMAEVRRRMIDTSSKTLTLGQLDERLRLLGI